MGNEFDKAVAGELNSVRSAPAVRHPFPTRSQSLQAEEPSSDDDATTEHDSNRSISYDPDSFAAAADPSVLEHDGDKPIIGKQTLTS